MITLARMTEEEFLRLPHDGRKWELVNGEAKEVPTSIVHDIIGMNIGALMTPHARGLGYITGAQAGFRMMDGNVRCPDVAFTRKSRFPDAKPPNTFAGFAADLCIEIICIEIISPSEVPAEMRQKIAEYFASGAVQVWHLFPEAQRVIAYTSPLDSHVSEAEEEIDAGNALPGFRCRVSDLFLLE